MSFVKFKNPKIKFKIIAPCTSFHVCCFLNVKCGKFTKISLKNAMCIFWHLINHSLDVSLCTVYKFTQMQFKD